MLMDIFQKILTLNILSPNVEKERGLFLKRIGDLLTEGYSIKHTLLFLERFEKPIIKQWVESIQKGLLQGSSFHEELAKIGFSSKICSQIYFASRYGDYGETIHHCGSQLLKEEEMKKKIRSLLNYPTILLLFLLSMLFIMRFLILPNMATLFLSNSMNTNIYSSKLVLFIYYTPQLLLGTLFLLVLTLYILWRKLERLSVLQQVNFFMKWPILNNYLKDYWTHFLFLEWGQLLKNGISFQELLAIMCAEDASAVLQETGAQLMNEMSQGKSIKEGLETLPFFKKEAMIVISHGENLGQLSTEMLIYSSYCESEFVDSIEKLLGKIQPIIFIFIALMIIAIYAAMMLPIFSLMEGF